MSLTSSNLISTSIPRSWNVAEPERVHAVRSSGVVKYVALPFKVDDFDEGTSCADYGDVMVNM